MAPNLLAGVTVYSVPPIYLSLSLQKTNVLFSHQQATEAWEHKKGVLARAVKLEESSPRKEEINQCLLKE